MSWNVGSFGHLVHFHKKSKKNENKSKNCSQTLQWTIELLLQKISNVSNKLKFASQNAHAHSNLASCEQTESDTQSTLAHFSLSVDVECWQLRDKNNASSIYSFIHLSNEF